MASERRRFESKAVVVTGAASGIGKAIAEAFAREGASVILTDVNKEAGALVAAEIVNAGYVARFQYQDVSQEADWSALSQTVEAQEGRLDVLVSNAGFAAFANVWQTDKETLERIFAVNLFAAIFGMRALYPLIKKSGAGAVVLMASAAGKGASGPVFAYGASKGAMCQMVRSLAVECGPDGVRVNAVCPGVIETPASQGLIRDPSSVLQPLILRTPMRRAAQPGEVSEAVLFLASDAASFITGVDLPVDGGFLAV